MHYEFVASVLSIVSAGLSYWYSRVATTAATRARAHGIVAASMASASEANAKSSTASASAATISVQKSARILEVAKTSVQSSNHEVCSECNKLVARFEHLEDGSIQCANCAVKE
jgi:hypothetical protein